MHVPDIVGSFWRGNGQAFLFGGWGLDMQGIRATTSSRHCAQTMRHTTWQSSPAFESRHLLFQGSAGVSDKTVFCMGSEWRRRRNRASIVMGWRPKCLPVTPRGCCDAFDKSLPNDRKMPNWFWNTNQKFDSQSEVLSNNAFIVGTLDSDRLCIV